MTNRSNGSKTLCVEDHLDVESVPALLCQIDTALDEGCRHFVIHLNRASRISSCGRLALQVIAARVAERGGEAIFSSDPVH